MNPAGGLVRGVGSPDGATGTKVTVGSVKSAGPDREVEIDDVTENSRLRTTSTAVPSRLRERFQIRTSPRDQKALPVSTPPRPPGTTSMRLPEKILIATLANDETPLPHLFQCARRMISCRTARFSVQPSSMNTS